MKSHHAKFSVSVAAMASALFSQGVQAATLNVDRGNANCSNSGSGTASQPFCTISAASAKAQAGDTVLVAAGTYSEDVTVASSGTQASPIVFTVAPGANVTVTGGTNGFTISGKSWITIDGFNVTQTSDDGIAVSSSSNITISRNHVTFSGEPVSGLIARGISFSGASSSLVVDNITDHNTDAGIFLTSGTSGVTVRRNVSFANARQYARAAAGIELYGTNGNVIEFNVTHDNEDSGINLRSGASNALIRGNAVYNNGDHGIDASNSSSPTIISNSVYKSVTSGINVEGSSTGASLANNVSVDNGINSPRSVGNFRVDSTAVSGTTMDYDQVFLSTTGTQIVFGSSSYSSLASFVSATGQESHGLQANPLFEGAASGDLRLLAGSPAIDSANSAASGETTVDADGNPRVDDPATPNTGAGPRTFDDRGAYEFQAGGAPTPTVTATPSNTPTRTPTPLPGTPTPTSTPAGTSTPTPTPTVTPTPTATPTPVDLPPSASLQVSRTGSLTVRADASASTDTDLTPIASYNFNFGDGTITGPQSASILPHTYTVAGRYTVTVTVADTAGNASSASKNVRAR